MIVLDTNILSEAMRPEPAQAVMDWLDRQPVPVLAITSITVAEILYGIARLPDGKRKQRLDRIARAMFEEDFAGKVWRLMAILRCIMPKWPAIVTPADAQSV